MSDENDDDFADLEILQLPNGASSERTPAEIEQQAFAVTTTSSLDHLCAMLDAADWLLARAKSIHHLAKQKAVEWIEANGEFDIGVMHYSVGHYSTIRCTDTKQCGHALLNHIGGDFDGFLEILVAQPFKSTFARKHLPQLAYSKLFRSTIHTHLVTGLPTKTLKRSDKRFLR